MATDIPSTFAIYVPKDFSPQVFGQIVFITTVSPAQHGLDGESFVNVRIITKEGEIRAWTALFALMLLVACQTVPMDRTVEGIPSFEALALLERGKALVVDVRSVDEKKLGGPTSTIEIQFGADDFQSRPASAAERDDFARKIHSLNTGDRTLLLLCQYGVRSGEAQRALAERGIRSLNIAGGWLGRGDAVGLKDWLH